jgi:glycosyltransferase involved in cell wall biosynthesis
MGRLQPAAMGIGKWLGYVDQYVLFRPALWRAARRADVVHVCDHSNAMHAGWIGGKPHVVTAHDLLAVRSALGEIPTNRTRWTGRVQQRWILQSLRRAQLVVCVSEQTRAELLRLGGPPPERCRVVHNAINYPYRPMLASEADPYLRELALDPAQPFFVHVGGNQWYKNRTGVLRLFAALIEHPAYAQHRVVMAGKPWTAEMHALCAELKLDGRVDERVDVSNEQLRALYSRAEALLFPSLAEGFGWPIAEAQACGCPVATTGRAPMTEVGADAAIYIDPDDPARAAVVIAEGLAQRPARVEAGLRNVKRFTGERLAAGYLDAYRHVLGERDVAATPGSDSA